MTTKPTWDQLGVGAAYVINLDRSKDRMARMRDQCDRLGVPVTRMPAVDGTRVPRRDLERDVTGVCRAFCTPSTIGCGLSHFKVWRDVLKKGYACALVMEDDAALTPNFVEGLAAALRDVPRDWDVLLLGCFGLCDRKREYPVGHKLARMVVPYELRDDPRTWGSVFVPEMFTGTHCYVVSRKGCQKLMRAIPKLSFHIDILMNHPSVDLYAVSPDLAYQRDMNDSTIANYDFPKTLTPALDGIRDPKGISLAYYLSAPMYQVLGQRITPWTFLFGILGLAMPSSAPYVAGLMLADVAIGGNVVTPAVAYVLGWVVRRRVLKI